MLDSLRVSIAAGEPPVLVTVLAAAALAALLLLALRRRAPASLLLILGTLPFAVVWSSPCNRIYSGHGFLHMSTLYQMLNGYYPPMNPILWDLPQLYPWAHLIPVAALVDWFRVPPTIGHPAINVLCACATLVLFYRAAALVFPGPDRTPRVFAVLLSVYSLTVFNQGPFVELLRTVTSYEAYDGRVLPPSNFTNWSGMPIGFVFHALFFYALLRVFVGPARVRGYVLLAVAIPGAAYGYPLMWPAMIAELCTAAALLLAYRRRSALVPVLSSLVAVAAGSLPFVPYMQQLGAARSGAAMLSAESHAATVLFTPDLGYLELKLARVALYLLPVALLMLWQRAKLRELWRERPLAVLILGGAAVVNVAMYVLLLVTPPLANEYKFLIYASFALGILAAPALHAIYVEHRAACFVIVACFLLPPTGNWLACGAWTACDRGVDERADLRRRDPGQDALYTWIRTRTDRDAAILDTTLEVPVFGQRQLFFGTGDWYQPGWTTSPHDLYAASRYPPELLSARERIVQEIYRPTADPVREDALAELARMTGTSEVFVVAREDPARRRLAATAGLEQVFANDAAAVYRLRKEDS